MNKINLEFTSEQAEALIPFFNNDLSFIYEWAEMIDESVDYREVKFLEECITLLRDAARMKIDVVLVVESVYHNTLMRLSSNIALIRERSTTAKDFDFLLDINEIITNGYKKFDLEVK